MGPLEAHMATRSPFILNGSKKGGGTITTVHVLVVISLFLEQ